MPKKKPTKIKHKVIDAIYQLARKKGKIGSADGLTDAELHAIWYKNCSIKYTIQLERTNYQLNFALGKQLNTIEFQQKQNVSTKPLLNMMVCWLPNKRKWKQWTKSVNKFVRSSLNTFAQH